MKRHTISQLLDTTLAGEEVTVCGWVRTFRNDQFLSINDGSSLSNLQLVVDRDNTDEALRKRLTTGAAISAVGTLIESQGKGQATEVEVKTLEVLGDADPEVYPIQMKRHTMEFLARRPICVSARAPSMRCSACAMACSLPFMSTSIRMGLTCCIPPS